ncbi:hypothetical protein N0V87_006881 [Didymella glomerata]|uniref:Uncharacterized protein n=1 Tax=Didymella glomerata TaxID=749621 RepID=A0A9W9BXM8_9PLEO|nr:hypothetical protein N0V87_006881 [Didymella glomerata]
MAAPTSKPASGDDQCTPVAYTVSEYNRSISPNSVTISFNVQADYTIDSRVSDPVKDSVNCEADGAIISSRPRQCNAKGEKLEELVFMLTGEQEEGKYRIHHKWQCNDATWESVNNLIFPPCTPVEDGTNGDTVKCVIKPFIFKPQNISKLEDDKKAVKDAKPTAKSSACKNPPKCDA